MLPPTQQRLLLVHAHPDDESITTGGIIARYCAAGAQVTVVTCTLGEEGEIIPPGLTELGSWAADQLGGYRDGELRAALAELGAVTHRYLGGIGRWRDSGMAGTPAADHPRAFVRGQLGEQAAQLRAVLDELRPQVVVSYDAFGGYGHPDHIRAHDITVAATAEADSVRRVYQVIAPSTAARIGLDRLRAAADVPFPVPANGELPTVPDELVTTTVDIAGQVPAKLAALRAHTTQIEVHSPTRSFALSNGLARSVDDVEYFALAVGDGAGADRDLFGGLDD